MKKNFNKLLILQLVFSFVIAILCLLACKYHDLTFFTTEVFEKSPEAGAVLFPVLFLVDLGAALLYGLVFFFIPWLGLLIVTLAQIIARLFQIGDNKRWKNITSTVFTYIALFFLVILCFFLMIVFINTTNIIMFLCLIGIVGNIVLFIMELLKIHKILKEEKTNMSNNIDLNQNPKLDIQNRSDN